MIKRFKIKLLRPFVLIVALALGACGYEGFSPNGSPTALVCALPYLSFLFERCTYITTGPMVTYVGLPAAGGADGGPGTATFSLPTGITTDGTYLYVTDFNGHTVRKVEIATAQVTTMAGLYNTSGTTNGTASAARFNNPAGITTDGSNLYVADTGNHTIRKIVISTGVVSTLAGTAGASGSTDATGTSASFNAPRGITTDGNNLYVADTGNHTIRKIVISTGVVSTLAGTVGASGTTSGTSSSARFNGPRGVTTDGSILYVADTANNLIRKVVLATSEVTTFAGNGVAGNGDGTGTASGFFSPAGITLNGGYLYIIDSGSGHARKVSIDHANVGTIARSLSVPEGVATDGLSLYITDSNANRLQYLP